MKQTAVLFDLDGVLIDTEGQYSNFGKASVKPITPKERILPRKSRVKLWCKYINNISWNRRMRKMR